MLSNVPTTIPTWQDMSTSAIDTITLTSSGNITTANPVFSIGSTGISDTISQHTFHVNGNAVIEGDLKLRGISVHDQITMISDKLESIDERLAILRPNPELEERWDQLRLLRQQYMELERELIEQNLVFDVLSGKRIDPK